MSPAPHQPSPPGSVPPSHIGGLVRSLLDSAIAYVQTRCELLRLESKEASTAVTRKVALFFFAACAFAFAYALVITALILLAHRRCDIPLEYAALGGAGIQVIVAVILIMIAKAPFRRGLFHHTLNEFEKDRQWLQLKSPPKKADNDQAPL